MSIKTDTAAQAAVNAAAAASMTPATTTPATNGPHGNAIEELIGQEWRFTSGEEDDASYFVLQPGGALTWFTYLIGASDWAEHDNCTWTTEGNAITLTVNDGFATMTGTLEDGKFTGTGTNQDGLTYIWTAEPASPPRVP